MKRTTGKFAVVAAAIALGACGQPEALVITPPADLLTCADAPTPPSIPPRDGTEARQLERDRIVLEAFLAERGAGADCRAKVAGVKAWVAEVSD